MNTSGNWARLANRFLGNPWPWKQVCPVLLFFHTFASREAFSSANPQSSSSSYRRTKYTVIWTGRSGTTAQYGKSHDMYWGTKRHSPTGFTKDEANGKKNKTKWIIGSRMGAAKHSILHAPVHLTRPPHPILHPSSMVPTPSSSHSLTLSVLSSCLRRNIPHPD